MWGPQKEGEIKMLNGAFEAECQSIERFVMNRAGRAKARKRQEKTGPFAWGTPAPPDAMEQMEQRATLVWLMHEARLSARQREYLFKYYWDGLSETEIAANEIGSDGSPITRQAVSLVVTTALRKLREAKDHLAIELVK